MKQGVRFFALPTEFCPDFVLLLRLRLRSEIMAGEGL